jgi:exopolysaccharide production protein ExoQ
LSALVALILCSAFVLYLLRLERKQAPEANRVLWIPTIWMLYSISKPLGSWFKTGGTLEIGSPLDRGFLTILLCVSLIVLLKRRFKWTDAIRNNPWLMVLLGYMLVSILWSPMPTISFKRWVRELVAIAMAFLISSERNPRLAIKSIIRRTIYILLPFSLILIKFYPAYGCEVARWSGKLMWIGVTPQKNWLSLLCVISAFFLIWVLRQRWKGSDIPVTKYQIYIELFLLFLSFLLLGGPQRTLTNSATSFIAFAVGLLAFAALLWTKKKGMILSRNALNIVAALIIIYGTVTPFIGRLSFWDVSSVVGRSETLTGRTHIWSTLIPPAMSKPLFGHGVGGFWTTTTRKITPSAHNGYLDVILILGFLGLGLVFLFILSCSSKAAMTLAADMDWGILFICYLLMFLVHNITESSIFTFTGSLTAIILFFSVTSTKDYLIKPSTS